MHGAIMRDYSVRNKSLTRYSCLIECPDIYLVATVHSLFSFISIKNSAEYQ